MVQNIYILAGIFMGWGLGANNSANIFGTGVSSGVIKYRTAIILTAIFVVAGSVIEGAKCIKTISSLTTLSPFHSFVCILSAAITMAVLTYYALPASTSQAIVGAIMGVAILQGNPDFSRLYKIIVCWMLTPLGGIFFSVVLFRLLKQCLLKHIKSVTALNNLFLAGIVLTGSYGAYALGANNVANVTGIYVATGILPASTAALIGGLSIALGVLTYSKKTMTTVGKGIVPLDPFSATVSVLSEALTLHIFTQIGVPVSSSQAIVGAVTGISIARDHRSLNLRTLNKIVIGWISTPIAAGVLSWTLIYLTQEFGNFVHLLHSLLNRLPSFHF